jgi:type IX secretion system PorP/SprF family membrane protein
MFSKINTVLLLLFVFLHTENTIAQDFHFSQFDLAPMYVSPALTGYMGAQNRIALKYRSQWGSVLQDNEYETMLFSYDGRLCPREGVSVAYGFNLVKDQVGFPSFRTNQYMGSVAFHLKLQNGLFASGGLQAGLLQYRLDTKSLNFENQFDQVFSFNTSLPSMEDFLNRDEINLLDIGGGALLYSTGKSPWNVGLAFHHINPKNYYAFTTNGVQDNNRTKVRWILDCKFLKTKLMPFLIRSFLEVDYD